MRRNPGPQSSEMEKLLKAELGAATISCHGSSGGGCISEGSTYNVDSGKVFVKVNRNKEVQDTLYRILYYLILEVPMFLFYFLSFFNFILFKRIFPRICSHR